MSETPDDNAGDTGGSGGGTNQQQSPGGQGQSTSGQQRGQPQAQPQGGPQSGQPQGGYQHGQPQAQTGPSVGDIFNRQDTMGEIKSGSVLYAVIGIGILVAAPLVSLLVGFGQSSGLATGASLLGVLLAALLAMEQEEALQGVADTLVYATSAVTAFIGTILLAIFGAFGGAIGAELGSTTVSTTNPSTGQQISQTVTPTFPTGDVIVAGIGIGIGAAVTAALAVWAVRSYLAESSDGAQGHASQQ